MYSLRGNFNIFSGTKGNNLKELTVKRVHRWKLQYLQTKVSMPINDIVDVEGLGEMTLRRC